ncbi:MAG: sigma 54-interacting transcriptional regulator [Verrucomicrobia bacterium]|nr:sigma 54-interacting transcriptional regulator [Verrucomicrobiota bacterium]MBU1855451.1 sigma 54-interacting transcriptional regulator [Verrucomicrobiota bacterium]
MAKILLVDDEVHLLKAMDMFLRSRKHDVMPVSDGRAAEHLIRSTPYDLIISDIRMMPVDGLHLLRIARESCPETPVILVTAYATLDVALDAIKAGAFDFVTKPFKTDNFMATVRRALDYPRIVDGAIQLDPPEPAPQRFNPLIIKSAEMQALCQHLEQLAPTDEAVLILGERGAGKRQVAQILHGLSQRKDRPFVSVDCSAGTVANLNAQLWGADSPTADSPTADLPMADLPAADLPMEKAGALEAAKGGTVVLEYIEELPAALQPSIIGLIKMRAFMRPGDTQVHQVDVRIMATSRALPVIQPGDDPQHVEWIQTLSAISLPVPPLRERRADLLPLISRWVYQRATPAKSDPWKMTAQAFDVLDQYPWPGNVEELERTLSQAMTKSREQRIDISELPSSLVEAVKQMKSLSQQHLQRNELRGKSFRDYIRLKQDNYRPLSGPKAERTS